MTYRVKGSYEIGVITSITLFSFPQTSVQRVNLLRQLYYNGPTTYTMRTRGSLSKTCRRSAVNDHCKIYMKP